MIPALLTAVLFAFSAIFGQRAARLFGALRANAIRLVLACVLLGLLTWITDSISGKTSLFPAVFPALFLSGIVGFGVGDIGLYLAYPRLGARLTILINFSLATLFAAWGDFAVLGLALSLLAMVRRLPRSLRIRTGPLAGSLRWTRRQSTMGRAGVCHSSRSRPGIWHHPQWLGQPHRGSKPRQHPRH